MFAGWGSCVARFRWPVLAVALVAVVSSGLWGLGVFGQLTEGGYNDPNSESAHAATIVQQALGTQSGDVVAIYTPTKGKVGDAALTKQIKARLAALPASAVASTSSYWQSKSSQYIAKDKSSAVAVITLVGPGDGLKADQFRTIKNDFAVDGATVQLAGGVPLNDASSTRSSSDLGTAELISLPITLVLLLFIFGSLVAAGLPVLIGGASVLGSLGILHAVASHTEVNSFAVNVASLLGLGMAIDYGLFMVGRFREEQAAGRSPVDAVRRTVGTAGRTVLFSATLLMIALAGLLLFPQGFLKSLAYGGLSAVALAAILSLTLLPALLAVLGPRVDKLPIRLPRRPATAPAGSVWARVAGFVLRHRVLVALPIVAILLLLASPVQGVHFGDSDERILPAGDPARVAVEKLKADYPQFANNGVQIVLSGTQNTGAFAAAARAVPGVDQLGPTVKTSQGAILTATLTSDDPYSASARDAVDGIRALPLPPGATLLVGGTTARNQDSLHATAAELPWMVALLAGATLVLMFLAFGSILLPIKAVVMSTLSLSATFGVLVWIFEDGHLSGLLDVTPAPLEVGIVVLMGAVVFGLSTDYEVFLLSRMVEARTRGATTAEAITTGLARTGRVISAAALLLIVVTGAFALSAVTTMRFVGVGMIIALLLDATIVRMLLVPAVLGLLGDAAWWAPGPLRRLQQRAGLSEPSEPSEYDVQAGKHARPEDTAVLAAAPSRRALPSTSPVPELLFRDVPSGALPALTAKAAPIALPAGPMDVTVVFPAVDASGLSSTVRIELEPTGTPDDAAETVDAELIEATTPAEDLEATGILTVDPSDITDAEVVADPESPLPESPLPESQLPESQLLESPLLESPLPESPLPESPLPESPLPESPLPESPLPESPLPESAVDESVNDSSVTGSAMTDQAAADPHSLASAVASSASAAAGPETADPDPDSAVAEPPVMHSDAPISALTEPTATDSAIADSTLADPTATHPAIAEPTATDSLLGASPGAEALATDSEFTDTPFTGPSFADTPFTGPPFADTPFTEPSFTDVPIADAVAAESPIADHVETNRQIEHASPAADEPALHATPAAHQAFAADPEDAAGELTRPAEAIPAYEPSASGAADIARDANQPPSLNEPSEPTRPAQHSEPADAEAATEAAAEPRPVTGWGEVSQPATTFSDGYPPGSAHEWAAAYQPVDAQEPTATHKPTEDPTATDAATAPHPGTGWGEVSQSATTLSESYPQDTAVEPVANDDHGVAGRQVVANEPATIDAPVVREGSFTPAEQVAAEQHATRDRQDAPDQSISLEASVAPDGRATLDKQAVLDTQGMPDERTTLDKQAVLDTQGMPDERTTLDKQAVLDTQGMPDERTTLDKQGLLDAPDFVDEQALPDSAGPVDEPGAAGGEPVSGYWSGGEAQATTEPHPGTGWGSVEQSGATVSEVRPQDVTHPPVVEDVRDLAERVGVAGKLGLRGEMDSDVHADDVAGTGSVVGSGSALEGLGDGDAAYGKVPEAEAEPAADPEAEPGAGPAVHAGAEVAGAHGSYAGADDDVEAAAYAGTESDAESAPGAGAERVAEPVFSADAEPAAAQPSYAEWEPTGAEAAAEPVLGADPELATAHQAYAEGESAPFGPEAPYSQAEPDVETAPYGYAEPEAEPALHAESGADAELSSETETETETEAGPAPGASDTPLFVGTGSSSYASLFPELFAPEPEPAATVERYPDWSEPTSEDAFFAPATADPFLYRQEPAADERYVTFTPADDAPPERADVGAASTVDLSGRFAAFSTGAEPIAGAAPAPTDAPEPATSAEPEPEPATATASEFEQTFAPAPQPAYESAFDWASPWATPEPADDPAPASEAPQPAWEPTPPPSTDYDYGSLPEPAFRPVPEPAAEGSAPRRPSDLSDVAAVWRQVIEHRPPVTERPADLAGYVGQNTRRPAPEPQPTEQPKPHRPTDLGSYPPVYREPAQREPAQREPAQREPAQREPAQREPAQREPAQHEPARREPSRLADFGDMIGGRRSAAGNREARPADLGQYGEPRQRPEGKKRPETLGDQKPVRRPSSLADTPAPRRPRDVAPADGPTRDLSGYVERE